MDKNTLLLAIANRAKVTFSSLRHRDFRYYWIGQSIKWTGTWMQRTAQVWLVYTLTDSPFALGVLGFFQFMPMLVFSLFAGVLVDRVSKKKLIFITQAGFMVQSIALFLLVWTNRVEYWHVLLLIAIFGTLQTVDIPSRQSWYYDLVGIDDLPNAISLNSTVTQMSKFVGPMLAGIVMAKYGMAFCFFLNGVSFIAVFASLFFIKDQGLPKPKEKKSIVKEIAEGLKHITADNTLRITLMMMMVFCTFAMNTQVIVPVFADTVLTRGVNGYTTLLSAMGVGAFVGAIYMANKSSREVKREQIVIDAVIISALHLATAYIRVYAASIVFLFIIGFYSITFLNMANAVIQLNIADSYRGRVMSIYTLVNQGSHPLGNLFAGTVMEYHGAAMGLISCGLMTVGLTGMIFIFTPMKEYFIRDHQENNIS